MAARTQRAVQRPANPPQSNRTKRGNAGAVQLQTLAERQLTTGRSVLIHGPTGVGKTVLAIHKAPRPTLVLDCDNGLDSVFGTDLDDQVFIWPPSNGSEYTWDDMSAFRDYVKAGDWQHQYKAIIVDNVTAGQKPVIREAIHELTSRARSKANVDDDDETSIDPDVPSRQGWGKIYRMFDQWIRDVRDAKRRGAHVIFTSGTSEWMDELEGYSRLMPDVEGKERNQIATHVDAVGWLEHDEDVRRLILAPSGAFVTKVRLPVAKHGSMPDEIIDPDFGKMIEAVEIVTQKKEEGTKKAATKKPTAGTAKKTTTTARKRKPRSTK
jgi:hypothetical protein